MMMIPSLLLGLGLGFLFLWLAKYGPAEERQVWAVGLVVAAMIYVGFAITAQAPAPWLLIECLGLLVYSSLAILGLRHRVGWLALSSGLLIPAEFELIDTYDSHGGFHGDGVYYVAFKTTKKSVEEYLSSSPWEKQWIEGKIPSVIFLSLTDLKSHREELLSSDKRFVFDREFEEGDFPSNGRMMVVMPSENTVLYFQWDS